jgi:hypothetical protein
MIPSRHTSSARTRMGAFSAAVVAAIIGLTPVAALAADEARPRPSADAAVIATWNEIAVNTITKPVAQGGRGANAESFLWYAFVHAAMYNAVVGITHEYELYKWHVRGPAIASPQAAAAVAAHDVLMEYFGANAAIAANLDAALGASLGQVPDGVSETLGIRYGQRAADRLIELRADDGRFAPIVFNVPLAPGVWRPTPPAHAAFFDPWLGQVEPLLLDSPTQIQPGPPPAISSATYVEEFNEVRDYGAKTGSLRTPEQTQLALFINDIPIIPIQTALRDLVSRRALNISDSARLFAAVDMSIADTIIAVWNGKFTYGWWRPITAIREADSDGNPLTTGVPNWEPLLANPPYAEWPSGLGGVVGAASTILSHLNGDGRVDLTITSPATGITRHYDDALVFQEEAIHARVWSGIHFTTSDEVGAEMGVEVATWALEHYFAPST